MIPLTRPFPPPLDRLHDWRPGDAVATIDGRPLEDILDLYYYAPEESTTALGIRRADGGELIVRLDPGDIQAVTECFAPMEFKTCACDCVFCFIDQNPKGMREPIYVKDEDYRFSFLYGNYITLTSLGRRGLERIIRQRLSPLYVSVHATDIDVRTRMLGIKRRFDVMVILKQLVEAGIEIHTQVVLCPGWNEGLILEKTFRDLLTLAAPKDDDEAAFTAVSRRGHGYEEGGMGEDADELNGDDQSVAPAQVDGQLGDALKNDDQPLAPAQVRATAASTCATDNAFGILAPAQLPCGEPTFATADDDDDLTGLAPAQPTDDGEPRIGGIRSLAIVPVGLSNHREGLTKLDPVTPEVANATIDQVAAWQAEARSQLGYGFVYLSDEFFLQTGRPFPPADDYDEFWQIDNAIGLTCRLRDTWREELEWAARDQDMPTTPLTVLTGELAATAWRREFTPVLEAAQAPKVDIIGVPNTFYGASVTVAGLLSGGDLRKALLELPQAPVRDVVLSPRVFNADGLTLDGLTLDDLTAGQPHRVHVGEDDGFIDFWRQLG
jgi:NifB/MoaA-like Fe-S oxidoreductase